MYNTHPSLLPLHRGWQPIFFSVLENTPIGISIHQVNIGLDKGLLLCQEKITIQPSETLKTLHTKCRLKLMEMVTIYWPQILNNNQQLFPQKSGGCYHNKKEFDLIFSKLNNGWNSSIEEISKLKYK